MRFGLKKLNTSLRRNFSRKGLNKNSFDFLKSLDIEDLNQESEFEDHYPVMHKDIEEEIKLFYEEKIKMKNEIKILECGIGTGAHAFRILEKFPKIS